jgi:hypothetical protein
MISHFGAAWRLLSLGEVIPRHQPGNKGHVAAGRPGQRVATRKRRHIQGTCRLSPLLSRPTAATPCRTPVTHVLHSRVQERTALIMFRIRNTNPSSRGAWSAGRILNSRSNRARA